jgi:hypothetical protein
MMLQTAPVLLYFHPTVGPNAKVDAQPVRFDFTNGPQSAEQIHAWIARQVPVDAPKPSVSRPINWIKIGSVTILSLGSITLLAVAWPYITPILQNRNLWAAFSLIAVLLFTSGHMFNHIRKTPYVQGDGKGGMNYFAGGFSNQFGLESQIIAAIYGPCVCDHLACAQGSPHCGCKGSAVRCVCLEWRTAVHVQLPPQCFPHKERWIPVLASSVLSVSLGPLSERRKMRVTGYLERFTDLTGRKKKPGFRTCCNILLL